jgi:hypothetical protein
LYIILNVGVSLYNTLMHIVYGIGGLKNLLRNAFFLFGIWHCYLYGHLAIWDRFRFPFLAEAFFAVFPNTSLMRKPSLFKSSVFFTWLRISYPAFRPKLVETLEHLKSAYLTLERNPSPDQTLLARHRASYIHCVNLYTLFEYAIPVLQDYGVAIKLKSTDSFRICFERLLLLFLLVRSSGSNMYTRSMVLFYGHWNYWAQNKVCFHVLQYQIAL